MALAWSEIENDGIPLTGGRALSTPATPDPREEAAWERLMSAAGMEPWQLITRSPVIADPAERAYADLIHAAGGTPWSTRQP